MSKRRVWPGRPYPMGAQFDGYGTNLAVYSGVAERVVELCLFDPEDPEGEERVDLHCGTGQVWHVFLVPCSPAAGRVPCSRRRPTTPSAARMFALGSA